MKKRSAVLQSALDRIAAGEKVSAVAHELHLQTSAIYQALTRIRKRTEAINRKAEILQNARRYEARRAVSMMEPETYDAESDAMMADEATRF